MFAPMRPTPTNATDGSICSGITKASAFVERNSAPVLLAAVFVLAAVVGTVQQPLAISDASGAPVPGARADFVDPAHRHDVEVSDSAGRVHARADFIPIAVDVSRTGYRPVHVALDTRAPDRVTLERALPVIGIVNVATGSAKSQHESPLATSVLDRPALALAPALATDRLLRQLPGFDRTRSNSAFTNYGQLRASFGGAGTDRGVVLLDGFPAQDGFGGQIDWQAYPTDEIQRVELLRGAGSALYGSGAIGGVLALDTFAPQTGRDAVPGGRAVVEVGSNSSADDGVYVRTPVGRNVGASLAATSTYFAYRDLPPNYASPLDHPAVASSGTTHARLRYDDGATSLDGSVLFASDHQDEGRTNYTFDRTLRQEDVTATQRVGSAFAQLRYYVRDTTVYNLADQFPTKPTVLRYRQHVPADENGFAASLRAQPGSTELAILVDQRRVNGVSQQYGPDGHTLQAFGSGVTLLQGIGFQATFHAPRLEALVGARADRVRYDDLALESIAKGKTTSQSVSGHAEGAVSPRVALRYDVAPRVALRLSSGGGFRAPYLNELVRGFNVGAVVMAPNPNLVPERSRTDDAGIDLLLGSGRLAFDVTQTRVTDAIAFRTISPTLMRRENIDRTQTNGETLTFAQPLSACTRLRLSGTSQYARVTSGPAAVVGKRLALVPERSATLGIDGAGGGPLGFSVDSSYVGQTYYDDLQTQPLGAALLVGATVRATTKSGATFSLIGDNLTHQRYLSSIDRYGEPLTVALRVGIPIGSQRLTSSRCGA
jgi:iron complex outermembrane receptor protein